MTSRDGSKQQEPRHPILAEGVVRHVGEPIAAVVAETLAQARDAAEAIEVDIEELPAVVDMRRRSAPDAPKVHESLTSNLCFDWGFLEDNKAKVDAAFETRAPRHHARARQQPAGGQPDGAALRDRRVRSRRPTSTRSSRPARTRTSSGC